MNERFSSYMYSQRLKSLNMCKISNFFVVQNSDIADISKAANNFTFSDNYNVEVRRFSYEFLFLKKCSNFFLEYLFE